MDIRCEPLPFGGLALVPVSDAGRDYLDSVIVDAEARIFSGGGCMTGFPADAIGFEPQDWPEIVRAARESGLVIEGVE